MEKAKQVMNYNNSSSTFTTKLFGPKHSSSSSSGTFASVFGPESTGPLGRDPSHNNPATGIINNNRYGNRGNNGVNNNNQRNPKVSEHEVVTSNNDPCYFSSSIYYGGQQVYSPNNTTNKSHPPLFKINEGKDYDSNGNSTNCASRGNWWEGSLYY